jgi:hypothetical protein
MNINKHARLTLAAQFLIQRVAAGLAEETAPTS